MRLHTFRGGIHPPENKHRTEGKAIQDLPLPRRLIVPLQQHTGAPCQPLVKEGDSVKAGQKIGESTGFVSSPVHAGISGTVTAVAPMPHPVLAAPVRSIVIECPEGAGPDGGSWTSRREWGSLSSDEILSIIKESGIVGLGGAAFPTHVKLSPPKEKRISTLIINGVECEPFLTADHRLMLERADGIIEGIRIILKILGLSKAVLAIEKNKPDAIALMREKCRGLSTPIEVMPLRVKYPQGAEKQLIRAVIGREVPGGGLPFDVGAIVQNVGTVFAVYEAVVFSKPLIERVLTVSGDGIAEPKNLRVRIGTPFAEILSFCGGGLPEGDAKLMMGGPMMGIAQYTAEVPVVKGTSGILLMTRGARTEKETTCIKCGRCVKVCPMYLMPNRIADWAEKDNFAKTEEYGVKDCMECGACTYVCDVKRPIVHLVKYSKLNLARKK